MQVPTMKFCISIVNIAIEGTLSQIFDIRPSSIPIKFRNNIQKNYVKSYPFFSIKKTTKTSNKILRHSSLDVNVIYSHKKFQIGK